MIQVLYKHNIDLISLDSAHPMNDLDMLCGNLIPIQGWINLVSAAKFVGAGKGNQLAIAQIDGRYGTHFFSFCFRYMSLYFGKFLLPCFFDFIFQKELS